jgi:hypothetical protein
MKQTCRFNLAGNKNLFLLIILLLATSSTVLFAQQNFTVTFTNDTGYDINELYISPSVSDDWHDDLLGGLSIRNGSSMDVSVPVLEDDVRLYDILAIDVDGDRYEMFEVDLSDTSGRAVTMTFESFADNNGVSEEDGGESYNQGYLDGYREAWREAYKEAYSEGYRSGLEDAVEIRE